MCAMNEWMNLRQGIEERGERSRRRRDGTKGEIHIFLYASDDNEICTTVNVKNRLYF